MMLTVAYFASRAITAATSRSRPCKLVKAGLEVVIVASLPDGDLAAHRRSAFTSGWAIHRRGGGCCLLLD